jgi:Uma2 family endonuclease
MSSPVSTAPVFELVPLPILAGKMPLLYEDEEEELHDLGEADFHTESMNIVRYGIREHLRFQPHYRAYSNMNLYYSMEDRRAYISPDNMVVAPFDPFLEGRTSYRIGVDGPAPVQTVEVLSPRSGQQEDLGAKLIVYAMLGVAEYLLIDITGRFLPELLLLKRLQPDRTWVDERDPDGGITSRLGFRIVIDTDGQLRVLDAATGKRYSRPGESSAAAEAKRQAEARAEAEAEARRRVEEELQELKAELARLRQQQGDRPAS